MIICLWNDLALGALHVSGWWSLALPLRHLLLYGFVIISLTFRYFSSCGRWRALSLHECPCRGNDRLLLAWNHRRLLYFNDSWRFSLFYKLLLFRLLSRLWWCSDCSTLWLTLRIIHGFCRCLGYDRDLLLSLRVSWRLPLDELLNHLHWRDHRLWLFPSLRLCRVLFGRRLWVMGRPGNRLLNFSGCLY